MGSTAKWKRSSKETTLQDRERKSRAERTFKIMTEVWKEKAIDSRS